MTFPDVFFFLFLLSKKSTVVIYFKLTETCLIQDLLTARVWRIYGPPQVQLILSPSYPALPSRLLSLSFPMASPPRREVKVRPA